MAFSTHIVKFWDTAAIAYFRGNNIMRGLWRGITGADTEKHPDGHNPTNIENPNILINPREATDF